MDRRLPTTEEFVDSSMEMLARVISTSSPQEVYRQLVDMEDTLACMASDLCVRSKRLQELDFDDVSSIDRVHNAKVTMQAAKTTRGMMLYALTEIKILHGADSVQAVVVRGKLNELDAQIARIEQVITLASTRLASR
jgi:hypothetical protein